MGENIRAFIKKHPRVYDKLKRLARRTRTARLEPVYRFLRYFSDVNNRRVRFIQIGANDGLRNDPIREFVVNDQWNGVFVEPLPNAFEMLKRNYAYLTKRRDLRFLQAAIAGPNSNNEEHLNFWSIDPEYLATLPTERRMQLMRVSSFNREHLMRALSSRDQAHVISVTTKLRTVSSITDEFFPGSSPDLIAIDAEGYESQIIPTINFSSLNVQAVLYESHNLGALKDYVVDVFSKNGYSNIPLGGDAVAVRNGTQCSAFVV